MKMNPAKALLAAAILAIPTCAAGGDTLEKIRKAREIRLGHREASVPFSYLDGEQKPVGFAMDLCSAVVDAVKVELELPEIRTGLQPVQLGNLIPLVENGSIDIVCGPTSNTLERQKVVAFSTTFFVANIGALVRKDSPVRTFEDLDEKPVSLTSGSTAIALLAARAQKRAFQTRNVLSADHAASFLALTTGRTTAFVMDDILLAGMVANSARPEDWRIIDDSLRADPYGLVIRKDDPKFKALVDRTLIGLMRKGEFQRLYGRWFTSPIPPRNINLDFPMTPTMKDAVLHPNDKGA